MSDPAHVRLGAQVVTGSCAGMDQRPDPDRLRRPRAGAGPMRRARVAAQSDPVAMGWMQGTPPPPGKRLSAADQSFFRFPALRWSVVHMREFLPTVDVSRGLGAPVPLARAPDPAIDAITFVPLGGDAPMRLDASHAANYTDGILVLHHGRIVYERYFGELRPDRVHAAMSMTKSFTGTLAALLAAEGALDPSAPVTRYVPELAGSAFAGASVRQVMDMTTCGEQVLPAAVVEDIRAGGSRAAFAGSGHATLPGGSYRHMWWVTHNTNGAYAARGVHGQTLYIDPTADMVIVRLASHPVAGNAANDPTSLPAWQALAAHLMARPDAGVTRAREAGPGA